MNMELNHRHPASSVDIIPSPHQGLNIDSTDWYGVPPECLKCGIHFELNGLVTIVINSCAYDRGYATSYLASVVSAGLGIPLARLRLYYSGALPAVRLTPRPVISTRMPAEVGLLSIALAAERLACLCREIIARGGKSLSKAFGWSETDVIFEPETGCFSSGSERVGLLELARKLRRAN